MSAGDWSAVALFVCASLLFARFIFLWAFEVWSMTRQGYWLDRNILVSGVCRPTWRHKAECLPDVESRHVPT